MSSIEQRFFNKLYEKRKIELYNEQNNIFQEWLNEKDYNNISNKLKISYLIDKLINIVKNKGYIIQYEKEFKNEIASLLYNNSD